MSAGNETGGGATPPEAAPEVSIGFVAKYHGPTDKHKVACFIVDGQPTKAKGKLASFMRALIAAGHEGVAHVEVMPWAINACDLAKSLRDRNVRIETRKGNPSRWVLISDVWEVLP